MVLQVLPDLNEGRWQYNGTATIDQGPHKGVSALLYQYTVKHNEGYGEVVASYKFYVTLVSQQSRGLPMRISQALNAVV